MITEMNWAWLLNVFLVLKTGIILVIYKVDSSVDEKIKVIFRYRYYFKWSNYFSIFQYGIDKGFFFLSLSLSHIHTDTYYSSLNLLPTQHLPFQYVLCSAQNDLVMVSWKPYTLQPFIRNCNLPLLLHRPASKMNKLNLNIASFIFQFA